MFTSSNFELPAKPIQISDITFCYHFKSLSKKYLITLISLCTAIGPKILEQCACILAKPLHHLFSTSLNRCSIPHEWCIHTVVPEYKSGDKAQATIICPKSLFNATSKVLEQTKLYPIFFLQLIWL